VDVGIGTSGDGWDMTVRGQIVRVHATRDAKGAITAELGTRHVLARVVKAGHLRHVFLDGRTYAIERVPDLPSGELNAAAHGGLRALIPGRVVALLVAPGAKVAKGTPLLVMEAMKMEHSFAAPADGTVIAFRCAQGDQVAEGVELIAFEAAK
jgi:3-methylcrotonyl-CoA carboxylase alpha subunit